ncbi:SOS response-associated peptidase [Palleronia sp. THAF1]|uniref:SOS response-associated peptidase n=1 Tax=Palleronia sp. THAF1 TaxID=2587842 RepID=UPI000F53CF03|nr:SOS response-associated peptidase [Palleronia sp. THAF1]
MCGRFAITLPSDAMAQLFSAVPANDLPDVPNYNVCPTNCVHAVVSDQDRRLQSMRWGFVPHCAKAVNDGPPLINARAETIADKRAFRAAVRARRCLIPADGFYEWTKGPDDARLPWWIARADGAPMVFAGIWQDWARDGETVRSCAIVTCAAQGDMAELHHRSPVILDADDWPLWLGEDGKGAARLMRGRDDLVWHRVGTEVNSNRSTGAQLREPL